MPERDLLRARELQRTGASIEASTLLAAFVVSLHRCMAIVVHTPTLTRRRSLVPPHFGLGAKRCGNRGLCHRDCWDGAGRVGSVAVENFSGVRDVDGELGDESVDAVELAFAAEELGESDLRHLTVEVIVEVEQVGLEE